MESFEKLFMSILSEEKAAKYEYGCIMLELDLDQKLWKNILSKIAKDDIYHGTKADKDKYGLEEEPHITLLYGVHSDEVDDSEVEKLCKSFKNVTLELKKISLFNKDEYDVVKFDVKNDDLISINTKLRKELPYTTSYPDFKPHATISYVKSGEGKKYVGDLDDADVMKVKAKSIIYSKPGSDYIIYNI